jgi:hypothetical protein
VNDTDYILLYIDNCEPALNAVLDCVTNGLSQQIGSDSRVRKLRQFIKGHIPDILYKSGDREQRRLIIDELINLPKVSANYWRGVYAYYLQKQREQMAFK